MHTNALERAIDGISQKLPGFFVGRYDVRYQNEEDFEQGRDFQIVELMAPRRKRPVSMIRAIRYSPPHRTLLQQWRLVFAIGAANRAKGYAPSSLLLLWRNWRQYSAAALSYPLAD